MWGDYLDIGRAEWRFVTHWWWAELLFIAAMFALAWAVSRG